MRRLRERARLVVKDPLAWVLAATALLFCVGLSWGLPATDGWDNDGVAPRDFLAGLVETFQPGKFYTYPPVHLVLLGALTSPITLVALAKAQSLAPPDVIREVIQTKYMTPIAYGARLTSLAMALGIAWSMAKIAEELRGKRAGLFAAAACGINAPLCYYAHTSNLDVPYLFWGSLGLLALVRAIARREPRRMRHVAIFAVLAVGTKDQAYALFLLAAPAALALWIALDARARSRELARAIAKETGIAIALGSVLLLVVDAIVFNPSGFRARLHFLLGSASQDFAAYSNDWAGRKLVVVDTLDHFSRYYPIVFVLFLFGGLALHVSSQRGDRAKLAAGFVPLLAGLSFTMLFNCVARRTDHRFLLPQYVLIAPYLGVALDAFVFGSRARSMRALAALVTLASFAPGVFACAALDANLVLDPRYDAESWMREHVRDGEHVEVHGLNVYLPRMPANAHVERVGPEPIEKRNPLPGVVEVIDAFEHASIRRPKWIVVSQGWAWRYLNEPEAPGHHGRVMAATIYEDARDADASGFFHALIRGERGYHMVHSAYWESTFWPRIDIHASTSREIWIYERND